MKSLVTLKEAAKYLGTSKNKIWRAVDSGELPATKGPAATRTGFFTLASYAQC